MSTLFIVDGYSILFRTYYSVGEMTTSKQIPIGGIFGFIRSILTLIQRYSVEHLVITLDSGKKTFRSEIYPQYKANRIACPEDLIPQFDILLEFLETSNICHSRKEGFEADDIIASITKQESTKKISVVTSDKDLMQLVDERVNCLDFFKGKFYASEDVMEKFGLMPKNIVDYLALLGDASDNIPGVKGCGEKGAVKLIQEFGSVENIIANINNISNNRLRKAMEQHHQSATLSKELASLRFDVPLQPLHFDISSINCDNLRKFIEKYEMKSLFYMCNKFEKQQNQPQKNLENKKPTLTQGQLF
ncbi:MAG: 5'-3' exonuclease [Candidatus Deianiraeaceae bacterium]|jgi:5'-3' exonuclease